MTNSSNNVAPSRAPFIGVWNVIRFNYDLFVLPALVAAVSLYLSIALEPTLAKLVALFIYAAALLSLLVPLLVSWWVYDYSPLYKLSWLPPILPKSSGPALNIHAGFDETSLLLRDHYPQFELEVMDFYDPIHHTERSIRRARAAQSPVAGTVPVNPLELGLRPNHYAAVFLLLALHEIRSAEERVTFLAQLREALTPGGRLVVVEHTRDLANFCAYTIGCLHFLSPQSLMEGFSAAGLHVVSESRVTPFLRVFALEGA